MRLYGNPTSTCTRKVLATFAEKGAWPDEIVVIDLAARQQKTLAHMARQPFGQIPVLDDGDFRMYESRAICRYLDEVLPGPSLTPATPHERAAMNQWISVEQSNVAPALMKLIYAEVIGPRRGQPMPPDADMIEHREHAGRMLDVVDARLAHAPYLVGSDFTLADLSYMPYLQGLSQARSAPVLEARHNVAAWWERLRSRPSWLRVLG